MIKIDIEKFNKELRNKTPEEIIAWALPYSEKRIVTTSFGIYSAVLLNTFNKKDKDIDVIWCDTGFNTSDTYDHANYLIKKFNLNINIYSPLVSTAYLKTFLGIPTIDDPKHKEFTKIVKLEPFQRAIKIHQPELWFTNIRVRQSTYRNSKDILSFSKNGILKVSPFYYWSDKDLDGYLSTNKLPKNESYYDPTKVYENRECGIHLQ